MDEMAAMAGLPIDTGAIVGPSSAAGEGGSGGGGGASGKGSVGSSEGGGSGSRDGPRTHIRFDTEGDVRLTASTSPRTAEQPSEVSSITRQLAQVLDSIIELQVQHSTDMLPPLTA